MDSPRGETRARILIRIPTSLKAKIVDLAKQEHRSLNRQIEFLLDRAVKNDSKSDVRSRLR